jgi:cell division protein FtsZ
MIFITAGMGGGTGTGAAPVIAKAAKSKGLLTVGIVTMPFKSEGPKRVSQAIKGLEEMKANTDSIVVIYNDNIAKIYGSLPMMEAFHKGDDVLATAAKGIAEMITRTDDINVDLEDVKTTMNNSGLAVMGSALTSGEDKIERAVEEALASPLLNQQDIRGARKILFNLSYDAQNPVTFEEATRIPDLIQKRASLNVGKMEADLIWGSGPSDDLKDGEVELTIVATSFEATSHHEMESEGNSTVARGEDDEVLVKWNIIERYNNIDEIVKQPAYLRRRMQLMGSTAKGAKNNILSEEGNNNLPEENTLF